MTERDRVSTSISGITVPLHSILTNFHWQARTHTNSRHSKNPSARRLRVCVVPQNSTILHSHSRPFPASHIHSALASTHGWHVAKPEVNPPPAIVDCCASLK